MRKILWVLLIASATALTLWCEYMGYALYDATLPFLLAATVLLGGCVRVAASNRELLQVWYGRALIGILAVEVLVMILTALYSYDVRAAALEIAALCIGAGWSYTRRSWCEVWTDTKEGSEE